MDQEVFFNITTFDKKKVDLKKTATSVEEYLKQVIVSRENCSEVASADIKTIPNFNKPLTLYVTEDKSLKCVCKYAPGKQWNLKKSQYFAEQRQLIENFIQQNVNNNEMDNLALPPIGDKDAWCKLCFETRLPNFNIDPALENKFSHHLGTPPTLSFVTNLTDNEINDLLPYQISYLIEHGYSRPVLEWIFSLLLVVKMPLLHDVCSSIRNLARNCRIWRSELEEKDSARIHELSAIIGIVSNFFGQQDLND